MAYDWFKRSVETTPWLPEPGQRAEDQREAVEAPEPESAPPPADDDPLTWAREAYARLKAQQQAGQAQQLAFQA